MPKFWFISFIFLYFDVNIYPLFILYINFNLSIKFETKSIEFDFIIHTALTLQISYPEAQKVVEWIMDLVPFITVRAINEYQMDWSQVLRLFIKEEIVSKKLTPLDQLYTRFCSSYVDLAYTPEFMSEYFVAYEAPRISKSSIKIPREVERVLDRYLLLRYLEDHSVEV